MNYQEGLVSRLVTQQFYNKIVRKIGLADFIVAREEK